MEALTPKRKCDESVPEAATNQAAVNKFIIASPKIVSVCAAPGGLGVNTQVPVEANRSLILTRPATSSVQLFTIVPMNPAVASHKGLGSPTATTATADSSTARRFKYATLNPNTLKRPAIRPELQSELTVTNTVATQTHPSFLRDGAKQASQAPADVFAVCKWCGHLSKNFTNCDGCKRNLDPNFKTYSPASNNLPQRAITTTTATYTSILPQTPTLILTPQASTSLIQSPSTVIKAGQFYGQHLTLHTPMTVPNGSPKILVMERQPAAIRRYRGKKKEEPECLTISSDEEEQTPTNRSDQSESESNLNQSNNGTAPMDTSQNETNQTTIIQTSTDKVDGLETTSGNVPGCKPPETKPGAKPPDGAADSSDKNTIHINCRSIRIGSYKIQSHHVQALSVKITSNQINFTVASIDGLKAVEVCIQELDIPRVLGHFGKVLPVLFIYTTPGYAASLRNQLHMTSKDKLYFDPCSEEETMKRITFLPVTLNEQQKVFLSKVFPGVLLEEIKQAVANEILIKSTPSQPGPQYLGVAKLPMNMQTRSQLSITPQPAKVLKEVVKLVTYPPPPQTGGIEINSEDLDCLTEGEFLNDVIIDFYLKYLVNERLSPEDKQRTHIFSSFFFPRLTTRNTDEETTVTMIRRRHNRVKTWTRHVDIFEKDFIVVPINQSSHWFLAVICYPGLITEVDSSPKAKGQEVKEAEGDDMEPANQQSPGDDSLAESPLGSMHETMETEEQESPLPASKTPNGEPMSSEESQPSQTEAAPPTSSQSPPTEMEKGPCILIFDSLPGNRRWKIVQILREYLAMEYETKKKDTRVFDRNSMKGINVTQLPRQENYTDCGIFLLQYVESFFESPMNKFSAPLPNLDNWFPESKIAGKRQELKELILSLQKQQQENNMNKSKTNSV